MPKVSIIIPVYNREKTIVEAIESVINQTFQNFEIIIIDDCSEDQTVKTIKEYQKKDKRIKLFCLKKKSGGPATPRNIGINNAQGDYVSFLDSDDIYLPDNLKIKSEILDKNHQIELVYDFSWVFEDCSKRIIDCFLVNTSNWLIRKKVFSKIGKFKEQKNGAEDIDWYLRYRMLKGCSRRYFVKKPLTMYRYHKYQFTKSFFSREKAILITKIRESILKEINRHEIFRKDQATILSWVACSYCHCGEIEKGRKAFLKSLHINFNWFSLFFLLVSFIEGGKYYKKAEILLNAVCQNSVWRIRKLLARWKYKSSYKIALNIINNF